MWGELLFPDERLDQINKIVNAKRIVPTFYGICRYCWTRKGRKPLGEGLGNQFLGHIKQVDAIVHVVRCFEDSNITLMWMVILILSGMLIQLILNSFIVILKLLIRALIKWLGY